MARYPRYTLHGPRSEYHRNLSERAYEYERELFAFFRYQMDDSGKSEHERRMMDLQAERRAFNIATAWKHSVILDDLRASFGTEVPDRSREETEGGIPIARVQTGKKADARRGKKVAATPVYRGQYIGR